MFNNLEGSKNHVSEHSRLESVEKEVIELKNMIYQLLEANKKYLITNNTSRYFYLFFMRIEYLHKLILKLFKALYFVTCLVLYLPKFYIFINL